MTRIALVDDDKNIVASLSLALKGEGFDVESFEDGAAALEALTSQPSDSFDIGIFDIKMPQLNGYHLLKEVRLNNPTLPIIFLSSKIEEQDELIGFTLGADDYITKPFSKYLLLARVTAVLRRHQTKIVSKIEKIK